MKKFNTLRVLFSCVLLGTLGLVGCKPSDSGSNGGGGGTSEKSNPAGSGTFSVETESVELIIGDSKLVAVTVDGEGTVQWASSDETVARGVGSSRGLNISAIGAGEAVLTGTLGSFTKTVAVTVITASISFASQTETIEFMQSKKLVLTSTLPATAKITWSSSEESVATVDEEGNVSALKEGTSTITARYNSKIQATCTVTVTWSEKPSDYREIAWGEEAAILGENAGTWVYWNDQGWVGANVVMIKNYYGDGKFHFQWAENNGAWFGFQIFYQLPTAVTGKTYRIQTTLTSDTAGYIRLANQDIEIHVGDNQIDVTIVQAETDATFDFQAGRMEGEVPIEAAYISFTDPVFTEVA
ncbi:MAG: Ig-like domain-containing protein [Bacilli bacterium]|nr:Ig-like domain-containing protein [Bacilli bacterium]